MNVVDGVCWEKFVSLIDADELDWLPEFKMADCEPEVHCIRGMAVDISEITTANPTFSTMTDSLLTPPITVTLSSSAQHSRDAMYFRLTVPHFELR